MVPDGPKWPQNQPNNGPPTYANADLIVNFCKANNIRMRGHCVTWANPIRVPKWAAALDNASLFSAIESRFESVITKYQHDFEHWDINNEMITNSFFQDRFGPAIRSWMFNRAHEIDPDLICMVNDFSVISSNRQTSIVQQVQKIESLGATVDAIGVQGHFNYGPPKGETILARLDNVATAKKPIWITEIGWPHRDSVNDLELSWGWINTAEYCDRIDDLRGQTELNNIDRVYLYAFEDDEWYQDRKNTLPFGLIDKKGIPKGLNCINQLTPDTKVSTGNTVNVKITKMAKRANDCSALMIGSTI